MKILKAFVGTLVASLALILSASAAHAQAPVPTGDTPGMIGGQTIGSGHMVIGAATGYPETQFRVMWGLGSNFDLGVFAGLTYGGLRRHYISGLRQDVGMDLQVPLRWTLLHMNKAAMALRVIPYFRVGQYDPSISAGGTIGVRFNIALPKIFSIIAGLETRAGIASVNGGDFGNRFNFFDGATYTIIGLETFFKDKWFFNVENDIGAVYGSRNIGADALYNVLFGFGYQLH